MNDASTSAGLMPVKMLAASLETGQLAEGWTLSDGTETEGGWRSYSQRVDFEAPFSQTPVVHLGLTGFDVDNCDSARLSLRADDIGPDGFTVVVQTWRDSRVYGVKLGWLALGC